MACFRGCKYNPESTFACTVPIFKPLFSAILVLDIWPENWQKKDVVYRCKFTPKLVKHYNYIATISKIRICVRTPSASATGKKIL